MCSHIMYICLHLCVINVYPLTHASVYQLIVLNGKWRWALLLVVKR